MLRQKFVPSTPQTSLCHTVLSRHGGGAMWQTKNHNSQRCKIYDTQYVLIKTIQQCCIKPTVFINKEIYNKCIFISKSLIFLTILKIMYKILTSHTNIYFSQSNFY